MVLTPSDDKLIIAGRFGTVNNVSQRGLAALDLSSGAILPWTAPSIVKNGVAVGVGRAGKAGIWELEADANAIYGTGWVYCGQGHRQPRGPVLGRARQRRDPMDRRLPRRPLRRVLRRHERLLDRPRARVRDHERHAAGLSGEPGQHAQCDGLYRSGEGHAPAHVQRQQHLRRLERLPRTGSRELVPRLDHGRRRRRPGRLDRHRCGRLPVDRRRAGLRQRAAVAGHHPLLAEPLDREELRAEAVGCGLGAGRVVDDERQGAGLDPGQLGS